MKKLFVNLFSTLNNMLSFEKGIDITDDYQVLKRKNIVIKNIIFFSNITYTLILFLISLIASGTSNWILTIIFVPVTFGLNRTLSKLINDSTNEKIKQQIAMYIASFVPATDISDIAVPEISVYPNPVEDILNITSSETISEIEIVNVMGQVVKRMEVNTDNVVCDVNELKAGVYILRIHGTNTESVVSQQKFIKE